MEWLVRWAETADCEEFLARRLAKKQTHGNTRGTITLYFDPDSLRGRCSKFQGFSSCTCPTAFSQIACCEALVVICGNDIATTYIKDDNVHFYLLSWHVAASIGRNLKTAQGVGKGWGVRNAYAMQVKSCVWRSTRNVRSNNEHAKDFRHRIAISMYRKRAICWDRMCGGLPALRFKGDIHRIYTSDGFRWPISMITVSQNERAYLSADPLRLSGVMCSRTHFGFLVLKSKAVTKPSWTETASVTGIPARPPVYKVKEFK